MPDAETSATLIEGLFCAAVDPTQWSQVLARLRDATGAVTASYVVIDPGSGTGSVVRDLASTPEMLAAYSAYYHKVDFYDACYAQGRFGPGVTWGSHWVMDDHAHAHSEFIADFLRPIGSFYFGGTVLMDGNAGRVALCAHRARHQGPFGATQLALFDALQPHVRRAALLERAVTQAQLGNALGAVLIERFRDAVLLVNQQGRVIRMNRRAEAHLVRGSVLSLRGGALAAARPGDSSRLSAAIAGALARTSRSVRLCGRAGERLQVIVMPLPAGAPSLSLAGVDAGPAVMLVLIDPDAPPCGSAAPLMQMFGLTAREAELAGWLSRGDRISGAATRMGLTPGSARQLLKRVYRKTHTTRQPELVALLAALPDIGDVR
ncbi:MAG: helix-turn-helix transcriptional regulator [Gammaproteobacteria bacterium]